MADKCLAKSSRTLLQLAILRDYMRRITYDSAIVNISVFIEQRNISFQNDISLKTMRLGVLSWQKLKHRETHGRIVSLARVRGAVFKVRGRWSPLLMWGGGGGQIWMFSLCGCLEQSDYWTFLESLLRGVIFINFKPLKSTFLLLSLIAHAESTSKSLQIMILNCRFL